MSVAFLLCIVILLGLAVMGTPIAYAILVASFAYLAATGQSIGISGKILLDGLYQSFILLAVPLFIIAANIMNAGSVSDRLLQFCVALVGRFRGGSATSTFFLRWSFPVCRDRRSPMRPESAR